MCLESKAREPKRYLSSRPDKAIGSAVRKYCTYSIGLQYFRTVRSSLTFNTVNGITRGVSSKCTLRSTGCWGALVVGFVALHTGIVVLYCTYSTYVPYSLSPYRVLYSDTASALSLCSRGTSLSLFSL